MALTPQQFEKLKTQLAVQKSQSSGSLGDSVSNAFKSGVGQIKKGFEQARNASNPFEAVESGLTLGAGAIGAASSPLAPIFAPVGKAVDYAADNISNNSSVQKFAMSDAGKKTARVAEDVGNLAAIAGTAMGAAKLPEAAPDFKTPSLVADTIDSIDSLKSRIAQPDVSEAVKVSLNPKKALAGSGQDIKVSVGGKLKNLSDVTPTENMKLQASTERALEKFTERAKVFSKDRSIQGGSPVEVVGSRVDKALTFADKKRQFIGQKMGDIEAKYVDEKLPIGTKTTSNFIDTVKSFDNPKYGVDTADAPVVRKLVEDFDKLEASGATIGERLDFVRSWTKYLQDAKDSFGNFKENATANTRIQNAIKVLKDETVDAVAAKDKDYRNLRSQYRTYKQLDEIGNSLLGKEGALGERVKGAATVKRAIQSNSDAGARQFLTKLKELTGYDAIKEGDIALTAMENVGDYQGLSLLNVIKEGKTGLINRALEKGQDLLVGNRSKRTKNYINSSKP